MLMVLSSRRGPCDSSPGSLMIADCSRAPTIKPGHLGRQCTVGCYHKNSPSLFMVAVCNRADHYIFALWFLLSSSSSFFPRLISAAADWMSTILRPMVWTVALV